MMILVVGTQSAASEMIVPTSFVAEKVWERSHIQQWIRTNPQVLGEDLLIVAEEFNRFDKSDDRLDLLALDRNGNVVIVEFKRDTFAGYADLQALRYVAMVSSLSLEELIPYYVDYLEKSEKVSCDLESAKERIFNFVNNPEFVELGSQPRAILCSQDFGAELTTTVLYLRSNGVDISCVRITPYKVGELYVIVPTKIIPLPEAEKYVVGVRKKEIARKETEQKKRERSFPFLLRNGAIKQGEVIYLRDHLPKYVQYDPASPRFQATVTGDYGIKRAIKWHEDNETYSISNLTWQVFNMYCSEGRNPGAITGAYHWSNEAGQNLWEMTQSLHEELSSG